MNFSEAAKLAMEATGFKKAELARATGYSYQHISDLLSGDRRWNEDSINRVCGALGITIEIKREEPQTSETEVMVNEHSH